ncbi:hypothetical protein [Canibacter zhoujuaniae]|uniref:hypothetical protein n=1 Tax=Canibacter zhoujuaniae TaxID=2708343 RepID=UPI0014240BA5|nr:hypothetical protein [Canibacter zhoujuaniae]
MRFKIVNAVAAVLGGGVLPAVMALTAEGLDRSVWAVVPALLQFILFLLAIVALHCAAGKYGKTAPPKGEQLVYLTLALVSWIVAMVATNYLYIFTPWLHFGAMVVIVALLLEALFKPADSAVNN